MCDILYERQYQSLSYGYRAGMNALLNRRRDKNLRQKLGKTLIVYLLF